MTIYEYHCDGCGSFTVLRPMGTATEEDRCPKCTDMARRVFEPPGLSRTPRGLATALGQAEASAFEPVVATRRTLVDR